VPPDPFGSSANGFGSGGRFQLTEVLAAGFVAAFVIVAAVVRQSVRTPGVFEPVLLGGVLILGHCSGARASARVRWRGERPRSRLGAAWLATWRTFRTLAPFLVGLLFFDGMRALTAYASPRLADGALVAADRWLLGEHAGVLVERLGNPWLTSIMIPAYSLHLLTIPLIVIFFHARGQPRQAQEAAVVLLVLSALGLVGYFTVPAVGPYVYQSDLFRSRFPGGGAQTAARGLAVIDRARGLARDCFPSLHTAHVLVIGELLRRHARRAFYGYLPFGTAVILSTVYLRIHYLVDVIAAVPVVAAALFGGIWLQDRWDRGGADPLSRDQGAKPGDVRRLR
jgi:hypothetical protein